MFAQINESDTTRFQLRANLTGNYQQGNVTVTTIKSRFDFWYAPVSDWVFKSQNSSLYQSFYKKKADNDIFSRNYFYYKPHNKIYPLLLPMCLRIIAGRLTCAVLPERVLPISYCSNKKCAQAFRKLQYEATTFTQRTFNYAEYDGSDKISFVESYLYVAGWNYLLQHHLRLYYDAYWQPAFNNSNNYWNTV